MRKWHAAACLTLVICAIGLTACGGSSSGSGGGSKSSINLSLISFNSPGSSLLPEFQKGADAAASVINANGGLGGRKLVINSCNSMLQPSAATVCAHKTLSSHPVAMIGCDLTWSASGLPVYAAEKVPSINCLNDKEDVTNKYSFGLTASAVGENRGLMRWLCTQSGVHSVVAMLPNLPQYPGQIYPESIQSPLHSCGKTANVVYYPLTAVDSTPYVTKALGFKPDFILYSGIGAQVDSFFESFKQNGWPASKTAVPDTDLLPSTTRPAAKLLNGVVVEGQFMTSNTTESSPELATFTKALHGDTTWTDDPNVAWAYAETMFVAQAAKAIGYDKFSASTFQQWLSTVKSAPVPLSHPMANPGPATAPQIKQPYTRIERFTGGKFAPVAAGPNKDGWINGW